MFREKKKINLTKNPDEDIFDRFLTQENEDSEIKQSQEVEKSLGTFYFRSISREKAQPTRAKTPDVGQYRPKFEIIAPKVVYFTSTKEKISKSKVVDQEAPKCLKNGIFCDFKIRQLQKKIAKLRTVINKTNVDAELLYKNNIINKEVLALFKSPSLKFIHQQPPKEGEMKTDPNIPKHEAYDPGNQNSHEIVGKVINYSNLKNELDGLMNKNKENIEKIENKIADKLCRTTPIPVPFNLQISRPPIAKPKDYSVKKELTLNSTIDYGDDRNVKLSFCQEKLRNTCSFDNYSKRKDVFNTGDASLVFMTLISSKFLK